MAGTWTAVVAGFGGMRMDEAGINFAPRLPPALSRISFGLNWQGRQLRVEIRPDEAEYRLVSGPPMRLHHHGEAIALDGEPQILPIPALEPVEPVEQPHGRAPRSRLSGSGTRRTFPEIAMPQPISLGREEEPLRQTG
jgi:alpha,alpha-trehalose phosphorylase